MILCAGECLIDMIPRQTADGLSAFVPLAGGSVYNTAIALGRLGAPVQFFCGMSADLFGDVLRADLEESGVDYSLAPKVDRPTTLAFVKLTDGHAEYAFYDENTAGRMISEDDIPDVSADAVFFGGISLVAEPAADTYGAMMAQVAPTKVTMIDPNIRPGFIKDEARYRARITGMLALADIVKTSDEDLAWLTGGTDAGVLFGDSATQVVLLTRGSEGVSVLTRDGGHFDVPAVKATVVDTVGAGDTFSAGFLAGLQASGDLTKAALPAVSNDALRAAVTLGTKVAAITVSRAGANPPWAHEL